VSSTSSLQVAFDNKLSAKDIQAVRQGETFEWTWVELKTELNGIFTNNLIAISDLDWAQDRLGGLVLDFDKIQDLSLVGLQT
jgi:hypothetical protein